MAFPPHPNESARLAALRRYRILDTLPEQEYDDIVLLASSICETPIALITLVDAERQWFKARLGLEVPETSRDVAFCAHTILRTDPLIVPDAKADERFTSNALVTGDPHIRFYAGVPLTTGEGHALGSLCVIDRQPRDLSPAQLASLQALGRQLMVVLDARHQRDQLLEAQQANQHAIARLTEQAEALRRSEKLFSTAFHACPAAISISWLADGVFMDVNESFLKLLGVPRDRIIGKSSVDLGMWGDAGERRTMAALIQKAGKLSGVERKVRMPGGEIRDVLVTAEVVRIEDEPCVLSMFLDITDRIRVESAVAQARDAALESVRIKAAFLANMSHEIRTPLNGVLGMTQLLLDTALTSEQRDFAETVRASAESLLVLINDILDFSKIEAGRLEFEEMDFDPREAVEGAVELLAAQAASKGLDLVVDIHPATPVLLRGDAGRLRQILVNLVGNAVKFTAQGEVFVCLRPEGESDGRAGLRFTVRDTGIGMAPEVQQRIFQAFAQADGSTSRKYGGTGLGLSICQKLVEMMGGQIGVTSAPGQGSTFWFTIRLPKPSGTSATGEVSGNTALTGVSVLVVDDNASVRQTLASQLTAWGMRPRCAASPAEAMQALRAEGRFDLALIDRHLPEDCGLDLARQICQSGLSPAPKVILLKPVGQKLPDEQLRDCGVAQCLPKPVRQSSLLDAVLTTLGRNLDRADPGRAAPANASALERSKLKVLLAEDNPVNQKLGVLQLGKLGYDAVVAGNGVEVLEALRRVPYDVILMDGQMPEMDGYETARAIRAAEAGTPGSHRAYIIALTANAMKGDREQCLEAGMDDYLTKPVRQHELREAMLRAGARLAAGAIIA